MRLFLIPNNILVNPHRTSRQSVVEFRKRRSILKEYYVDKSGKASNNVHATLARPLDQIVSTAPNRRSNLITALNKEEFNQLTEWRKQDVVKRSRRVLPLPISLTTDDQIGQTWKQQYIKSIAKCEQAENLVDQVPLSVKFLVESHPELLEQTFPELLSSYKQLLSSSPSKTSVQSSEVVASKLHFPFIDSNFDGENQNDLDVLNENASKALADVEYKNFLKHKQLMKYMVDSFANIRNTEFEAEIKGWTSQFWLR